MSSDLALLYELQTVDTGIVERQRALASLDDGTAARAQLADAEQRLKEAEEKLHQTRTTLRDKELRLASTEEERNDKHSRCYGGTVSDPKELAALERKIAELTALKGKLEEQILGLMDQVEEEEQAVAALADQVQRLRATAEDREAHYKMDTERLTREIQELGARRTELVAQLDPSLLKTYDQLRDRLGGVAVAGVVAYTCQACHTAVPRDQADRIGKSATPIRCESCRRILWLV